MKEDLEKFINWMFEEKNKTFVKNAPATRVAQLYNKETNSSISHIFVSTHRFRWILINRIPYDIGKLPPFILNSELFKKYAKSDNVFIETLDGPLWEKDEKDEKNN